MPEPVILAIRPTQIYATESRAVICTRSLPSLHGTRICWPQRRQSNLRFDRNDDTS